MKATPEFLLTAHLPQEPEIIWVDFARHTLGRVVVVELLSQGRRVKGLGGLGPRYGFSFVAQKGHHRGLGFFDTHTRTKPGKVCSDTGSSTH